MTTTENVVLKVIRYKIKELEDKIEGGQDGDYMFDFSKKLLVDLKKKEQILQTEAPAIEAGKQDLVELFHRLDKVEEKNNCLRVAVLDKLANAIESVGNFLIKVVAKKIRDYTFKISTPCAIKFPNKQNTSNFKFGKFSQWFNKGTK